MKNILSGSNDTMGKDCKDGNGHKKRLLKKSEIKGFRDKLIEKQEGLCEICGRSFEKDNLTPTLDHDHDTYLVRGVLCTSCNQVEGRFRKLLKRYGLGNFDMGFILRNMAEYVEKEQYPYIHPMHAPKPKKLQKRSYQELVKVIEEANGYLNRPIKIPDYPKSGRLTKRLEQLYKQFGIVPKFYK